MSPGRRWLFAGVLVALPLLFLECAAWLALAVGPASLRDIRRTPELYARQRASVAEMLDVQDDELATFDPVLGWRPKPGTATRQDVINAAGLRAGREYDRRAAPGRVRVAAFGDSFVYGSEVPAEEAWPAQVEALDPRLEILNYGVPAYGPGQAYLRFEREWRDHHPRVVLMGFSPWQLERLVSVTTAFRPTLTAFGTKPRYVLDEAGELRLLPNPIARLEDARAYAERPEKILELAPHDFWYEPWIYENPLYDWSAAVRLVSTLGSRLYKRYLDPERPLAGPSGRAVYNVESQAFAILTRLVERFVAETRAGGAAPLVVVFPDVYSLERLRRGVEGIQSPLLAWLREHDVPHVDLPAWFLERSRESDPAPWFAELGHYSAAGNRVAAEAIAPALAAAAERD